MVEKLRTFFEYCMKLMQWSEPENDRKVFLHQAFGAAQFAYDNANSLQEKEDILKLWSDWKEVFEIEVYR